MSQSNQLRRISLYSIGLAVCFILFITYQVIAALSYKSQETNPVYVGIMTSDSIYDQSWGSLAFVGQQKMMEKYPVKVDLISEVKTPERMEEVALQYIEQGAKLIIGHGREFTDSFTALALQYPNVHFVTINGHATYENQSAFTTHPESYAYFAGIVASRMTKTNKVALIDTIAGDVGGQKGFVDSVKNYNDRIDVMIRKVGSRDDEVRAAEITRELVEQGVDVIFTQGNGFNRAVIHEAEKANVYVIGFVTDQAYMAQNHVITSVLIDLSQAYVAIMDQYFSEEGLQSGTNILDFKEGVYALAPFGPMVPEYLQEHVLNKIELYKQGEFSLTPYIINKLEDSA